MQRTPEDLIRSWLGHANKTIDADSFFHEYLGTDRHGVDQGTSR
jgi:hypothetical protein